ncbi:MAG: phenylacetate--CoA ligase family protein, partial [Dehalococcoidia bacterium]|nr:phenylacetate--CoA ligase family protein [Dehalococcoidia bacterium]
HNRELRRIVKYAYNNSPPMRAKFERVGAKPSDIQNLKGLEAIPVTPKEELRRLQKENPPFGGLVGLPINKLSRIFVSPGPIYDVEGPRRRGNEVIAFYSLGFRPGDIVMN